MNKCTGKQTGRNAFNSNSMSPTIRKVVNDSEINVLLRQEQLRNSRAKVNHAHRSRMCKTPIVMYFASQKFRVTPAIHYHIKPRDIRNIYISKVIIN